MATLNHCRLLYASKSAYRVETNCPTGMYPLHVVNPKCTLAIPLPIIPENTIRQHTSIGLISAP
ncbi:MAG: hypothetical protein ACJAZK_000594 [Psychroserpens sp.]|jgi:hypothetical protein|uniref:hypothetical protein n=1 Tax=Psychroserpens sp. TaxID=2020870 RepID=UPI0039E4A567